MLRFWVGGYTPFSAIPCSFVNEFACDKPHYPYELPKGWVWCKLGDLFVLQAGKNITAKDIFTEQSEQHNYPCFGGNGIRGYVTNSNRNGEFPIIGRQGALCGNINLAIGEFYATEHAVVVERLSDTDLMWAYYTLIELNLNQYATATAQPGIAVNIINNVPIPVPPLKEQCRISKVVKLLFSLVDNIEQCKIDIQASIKQAKSKILDLAIHGKLVPQDPNDEPARELLKRINPKAEITCDNPQYENLPNGWCECTLGSLFLFIRNGINIRQDKSKIGYPITRIETISSEFIDRSRMGYAAITEENYSDYYLQKNDILMSHINSPIHVGKCALCDIKAGEKIIHGMNLLCLRPYPDIEAKFILIVFKSPYFKNEIRPFIKNAVNQASINIRNLSSVHLYLPPVSEQHRIVAKIEELFTQLDKIEVSL